MYAKVFVFALLAITLVLAKQENEIGQAKRDVALLFKPLHEEVHKLKIAEYKKVEKSGISSTDVGLLKKEITEFNGEIQKKISIDKIVTLGDLLKASLEGPEKYEEVKAAAKNNIDADIVNATTKFAELAKYIDEAIKEKLPPAP